MKSLFQLGLAGALASFALLAGCSSPAYLDLGDDGLGTEGDDVGGNPLECNSREERRAYVGFGETELTSDRVNEAHNLNRARVKPYAVLAGEFKRALGATPSSLAGAASTFGEAKARWLEEPRSGALELDALFRVSFQGCLDVTAEGNLYAAMPDEVSAEKNCGEFIRKFWSQDATAEALEACTTYATTALAKEKEPRRRWAYVCASVLTSAPFLSY